MLRPPNCPLGQHHAGQRRDPLGRPEHAREAVQRVGRHVVERPAARLLEVPGGVDRAGRARHALGLLLLVVTAERATADRPADLADRALRDQLAGACDLRAQHLAGRGDDPQALLLGERDQRIGLGDRRRHRLVEVHVLAGLEREPAVLGVQADRRGQRHGVDLVVSEQLGERRVRLRHVVVAGCRLRALEHRIAERLDDHGLAHVVLGQVRQQRPQHQRADADDAEPQRCGAHAPTSAAAGRCAMATVRSSALDRRAASITSMT